MTPSTKGNAGARRLITNLTARERRFLFEVIDGKSGAEAYLAIAMKAGLTTDRARAPASRMLKRIRGKADWQQVLEEVDLGDLRLIREIERKLKAMTTKFYEDKVICDVEDNGTQMRALELLARLLGRDKAELTVHHDLVEIVPAPKPEEQPEETEV